MSEYWNQKGIPHKGWSLIDVIDIREDGQSEAETDYETCMMCGNDKIRYVHIVENPEVVDSFKVGCVCSGKMTITYSFTETEKQKYTKSKLEKFLERKVLTLFTKLKLPFLMELNI
jgi:hypothetical protein